MVSYLIHLGYSFVFSNIITEISVECCLIYNSMSLGWCTRSIASGDGVHREKKVGNRWLRVSQTEKKTNETILKTANSKMEIWAKSGEDKQNF